MSEMIERVARALCASAGFLPDAESNDPFDEGQKHWTLFVKDARAAIEAMREPTDGQRNAYYELSHKTETMVDAYWERAIDAALSH